MTADQQHRARQALAFVAQTLRPDWHPQGITAAIEQLHQDRQPLGVIAKATIAAALTSSTKTPGGIAARIRDGFDGSNTMPATPSPRRLHTCKRCGNYVTETDHDAHCHRRADPHEGRELARQAMQAAINKEDSTDA